MLANYSSFRAVKLYTVDGFPGNLTNLIGWQRGLFTS
jgi:hypothetical protein